MTLTDNPFIHHQARMTRLIPSRFVPNALYIPGLEAHALTPGDGAVLRDVAHDQATFELLLELDAYTNDHVRIMRGQPLDDVVHPHLIQAAHGGAYHQVRNGAFLHPSNSRFNGPDYGAWYSAMSATTAAHEVRFHFIARALDEHLVDGESTDYTAFTHQVDHLLFRAEYDPAYATGLTRDPDDYAPGQALAQTLREQLHAGVLYWSIRRPGHRCAALLHPYLIRDLHIGERFRVTWHAETKTATVNPI